MNFGMIYNNNKIDKAKEYIMQKQVCIGCRTAFQDNQKIMPQNLTTEYKDYKLPLKDDKSKWGILKAIVSFLNSQGGTIYIGINESQGAVQGILLTRKEQDGFKLFMKQLLERVHPKIDLNNRQQVIIQFVPVIRRKEFQGKYVVKIIVQQGDPSRLYYFGQKIKLEGPTGKVDQIQAFYAYARHNMGGVTQIKGISLKQEIHKRATIPNKLASPTHEGCNPQPPHLQLQIRKIYFSNTLKEHFQVIQAGLQMYFGTIDYENQYIEEERVTCVEVQDEDEFAVVKTFITENIDEWNKEIFKDYDVFFEVRGEKDNYFQIQNKPKGKKVKKEEERPKKQEKIVKQNKKLPNFNKQQKKEKKEFSKKQFVPRPIVQSPQKNFTKKFALTLSHINPHTSQQLQNYLLNSLCQKSQKYVVRYFNTIEIFLSSQFEQEKYMRAICKNSEILCNFGNKGIIYLGKNIGQIRIFNYDKNRLDQMVAMLQLLMEEDLKQINLDKKEGRYSILLKMKDKSTACEWLDNLLQGRCLWEFSDKGNAKRHSKGGKIVAHLELV